MRVYLFFLKNFKSIIRSWSQAPYFPNKRKGTNTYIGPYLISLINCLNLLQFNQWSYWVFCIYALYFKSGIPDISFRLFTFFFQYSPRIITCCLLIFGFARIKIRPCDHILPFLFCFITSFNPLCPNCRIQTFTLTGLIWTAFIPSIFV